MLREGRERERKRKGWRAGIIIIIVVVFVFTTSNAEVKPPTISEEDSLRSLYNFFVGIVHYLPNSLTTKPKRKRSVCGTLRIHDYKFIIIPYIRHQQQLVELTNRKIIIIINIILSFLLHCTHILLSHLYRGLLLACVVCISIP